MINIIFVVNKMWTKHDFFPDVAMLKENADFCTAATLLQVSMMTRWKILYVSDHFSCIHFTSARKNNKKTKKKTPPPI